MYLLYDVLIIISAIFLLPVLALKRLLMRLDSYGIRERFGLYKEGRFGVLENRKTVWMHAASVGETNVVLLLARQIKKDYPDHAVLITNMTKNGLLVAQESEFVDMALLFPIDLSFVVERLLKLVQPEIVIVVETEIWPNFTRMAQRLDIPLVMVNGRVSDRSFPRYKAIRMLLKPILQRYAVFCMQSQEDMERIAVLGAETKKIENTGNLKFDYCPQDVTAEQVQQRKHQYRLSEDMSIMVAGSTHDKEELLLVEAYREISPKLGKELVLVLIPRYPERASEVQKMCVDNGLTCRLRSTLNSADPLLSSGDVLLVDTLGEVLDFYSVADLVFVGGSFVPVGGHNLLEAALLSKPVLFGPNVQNFKEIAAKLVRAGAGVKMENQRALVKQGAIILNDPVRARAMGEAGRSLIVENAGATERTMRYITKILY